jgi:MoxR-like ATPase
MRLSKAKELMSTVLWDLNETILLEGETGVGKSQLVAALAQEKNFELIDLRLGQMEVGDLIGMPMLIGNETHWARPCWWPRR